MDHMCASHSPTTRSMEPPRYMAVPALLTIPIILACGLRWQGLAVVIGVGAAVHFAVRRMPAPGGCASQPPPGHPLVFKAIAMAIGVAVTGGLSSPMVVILPTPILLAWTVYGWGRHAMVVAATVIATLPVLLLLPDAWTHPPLSRPAFELLVAWFSFLAVLGMTSQIARLHRGLRTTSASLDRVRDGVLDDAARRRRALEVVGARLAHDLKNPLAAIKSLLQLERDQHARDERSHRRHAVLLAEVERMEALVRDYLSYSRPLDELEPEDVALAEVVDEVITVLDGRAEASGVRLTRRGDVGRVRVDPRRLKEALLNLVSNALEATPRGGRVEVRCERADVGVRVVVSDTGRGMTPAVAARVGTPFFTTRDGGTGLGVVIARSVIVQHGGTLDFADRPGGGTDATVLLPQNLETAHG